MAEDNKSEKKSGWKSLFLNDESNTQEHATTKPAVKDMNTKKTFPSQNSNTSNFVQGTDSVFDSPNNSSALQNSGTIDSIVLQKVKEAYQNNFIKLNKPGYDFFEFFNGVRKTGVDKPGVYAMALDMASSIEHTITKELLSSQADGYISQINGLHKSQLEQGENKKKSIIATQESETHHLTSELSNLREQLEAIKTQIQDKESKLSSVSSKYEPQLRDIDQKLMANDMIKNQMVVEIEKVKTGINNII